MKFCIALLVIIAVTMADSNSVRSRYLDSDCPRVCSRIWRPVCAKLNGLTVSIPNKCTLENLIHCESDVNKIWEFLHVGSCQSDDEISEEEDAELEPTLNEESVKYEDEDERPMDDDQVAEVLHWSIDYELKEE